MTDDGKPAFDPTQPFQAVADKPAFDPSQPFEAAAAPGSSVAGVGKSLASGLGEGLIGLAGLPGDLDNLLAKGNHYRIDSSGFHYGPAPTGETSLPTSASLQKNVEGVTGEFYKPQGAAEDIASKIGQFAPAVIGGPEAMAAKLATRVVAPAIASEAAGKLAEGTAAQPYAEAAGALLGGAGASAALRKGSALLAARGAAEVPTVDELKTAARAGYNHPDVEAVRIAPDATDKLADTISSDLQFGPNSGFRPTNRAHAPVFDELENLRSDTSQGAAAGPMPKTVADLDNVRQGLGNLAKERDAAGQFTPAAAAAQRAIGHIDNFLPNLQQGDLLAGDAAKANGILGEARQNWGAAKRAEAVQTLAANAEINAASANSGANLQNATKQAFKPLLKNNAAKAIGYTDIEKQALNKIVRGTWTGTIARGAGNLLGGGGGLGMLAGGAAGYEEGGIPGAIAVGLAGRALKSIGTRSTLGAVKNLDTLLRSRAPEALKVAAQNPKIVQLLPSDSVKALRTMILAEPGLAKISNGSGDNSDQRRQAIGQPGP